MTRWLGLVAIAAVVAGIITYKTVVRSDKPIEGVAASRPVSPAVVLFANPREAGDACGCGQIIRMVRASASRGAAVREVDPAKEPEVAKKYGVTVAPTVLVLSQEGAVVQRLVGESAETIEYIQLALNQAEKAKP